MGLAFVTATAIFQLFLMLGAGFLLAKAKIVTTNAAETMTDILVYLTNPLALISSFLAQDFDAAHTKGLLIGTVLSVYIFLLMIVMTTAGIKKGSPNWEVNRTSMVYTNVGYVGLPLITAVLGQEGAFFLSSFIAVNTVLIFTHGQTTLTGDFNRKQLLKCVLSPNIIAICIGLFLYFSQVKVPAVILTPANQLANCNTCFAMLIAGITIANRKMGDALKIPKLYLVCAVKVLLMPLLLIPAALIFDIQQEVFLACLIGAACPAAAFVPIFALRGGKDAGYAYGIFTITTLGCIITAPLMVALYFAVR